MSSQPVECDLPEVFGSSPDITTISYEVSTTSIVYGLLEVERHRLLRQYRANFHAAAHSSPCQVTYNLACQYLKNVHEVQKAAADLASKSDQDSIIFNDSGPPLLEPREASPITGIPPSHVPSETAPGAIATDGEQVEKWYEYWTDKVDGFGEWGIPSSLLGGFRGGHTHGKGIERAWASVGEQQTTPEGNGNSDDGTVDSHHLQIISLHGIRDINCTCHNGKHSKYTQQEVFAFEDEAGHVVRQDSRHPTKCPTKAPNIVRLCLGTWILGIIQHPTGRALARTLVQHMLRWCCGPNSSPIHAPDSSPGRALNASQRIDTIIEYEVRPGELARHTGLFVLQDGKRGLKRRKVKPSDLDDAYGDWVPLPAEGYSEGADEDANDTEMGGKRKRDSPGETIVKFWCFVSSTRVSASRLHGVLPAVKVPQPEFNSQRRLNTTNGSRHFNRGCHLDRDVTGTGYAGMASTCPTLSGQVPATGEAGSCNAGVELLMLQGALGVAAKTLSLSRLRSVPSMSGEWRGRAWFPTTLELLGSIYQLGHGGHPCKHPAPAVRTMIVIDVGHIHSIKFRYSTTVDPATCATFASLEMFRLLNVVGNINVKDYMGTLEQLTNACDVRGVPCWCCPHNNINLPKGWRDVAPEFQPMSTKIGLWAQGGVTSLRRLLKEHLKG
ncbi:hypothetical protein DFH07DRAFT_781909 [Mycena maculata]|uniref:Uncharacterized protein n=1 Tax=Mycena maculata TaxID=230809 RepID=A0AAD7HXI5_9AGAR|nr:hypothetical protein DFH07DRAFT_781909 [Mycena maculata]